MKREMLGETSGDAYRDAGYTYDSLGRIKTYTPAVPSGYGAIEYTWNNLSQKTSMKVPLGVNNLARLVEYLYDNTGRQAGMNVKPDTAASSTGAPDPDSGATTRFAYDANQNRVRLATKAGSVYQFVYDPTASIPAVVYEQGPTYRYVNVREPDGALVSRERWNDQGVEDGAYTYHFDGLGSTRAITDESGVVTDTYDYDEWGNVTHTSGSTADNPYLYVGQYGYYTHYQEPSMNPLDQTAGRKLLQLGVRYYDPALARFTQGDPASSGHGTPYAYADDEPVTLLDPDGLVARPGLPKKFPGCNQPISKGSKRTKDDEIADALSKICQALKAGKCKSCTYDKSTACHLKFCDNPHVQCKAQTSDECAPVDCSSVPGDAGYWNNCKPGRQKPGDTITICPNTWDNPGCNHWPGMPWTAVAGALLHEMNHLCGDCSEVHNDNRVGDCLREVFGLK